MSSDERDAIRARLAACTTVLPSIECSEAAKDIWRMQDLLRQELDGAAGDLPAHYGRSRVTEALHRYTPAQLLAALEGAQAEARDRGELQYFNGVTNWRPDQIDRNIARAQSSGRTESGARAAFDHLYRSVDPRWWTALPVAERSQILAGLERAFGDEAHDVLRAALRHLADTATRAPSRAEIRAAIGARKKREATAPALQESGDVSAIAQAVGAALFGGADLVSVPCEECGKDAGLPAQILELHKQLGDPALCGSCATWRLDPGRMAQAIISKMPRWPGGRGRRPTTEEIERCHRHGYGRTLTEAMRRAGWASHREDAA